MRSKTYEAGLAVRRQVLGDAYVDASLARADDFDAPLQDFLTEHAWGAVWTRPGLSLRQRSLLNLAILTAINRPGELALHLRGALNNGVTRAEIREVFLHCGAYCGAPAALDAFKTARRVFAEIDAEGGTPA
ncbi:4-carboxymuconolactone decarboxylase [Pseudorhodoferax sp.]|uniref:4-carboxymuconolactone decarboxylase n=1 Tax=Pseudorhodoferax sp. TaxID=1993553 RepID=UPI002DD679CB|nr:4-carboxymuconolactone decarboxylase [Pseudorhodoferax sp.]